MGNCDWLIINSLVERTEQFHERSPNTVVLKQSHFHLQTTCENTNRLFPKVLVAGCSLLSSPALTDTAIHTAPFLCSRICDSEPRGSRTSHKDRDNCEVITQAVRVMRVNLPREFSRVITHSTAEAQVSVLQAQREAFIHVPHMKAIQLGRTVKLHT